VTLDQGPRARYRFGIDLPVNGRLKKATVNVYDGEHFVTNDKADLESGEERRKLARRLARILKCDPEVVHEGLERAWKETYPQAKAQQEAKASTPVAQNQGDCLLQLAAGQDFFHAPDGRAYATVALTAVGEGKPRLATLAVRGRDFRVWLSERYFREAGKPPAAQALQDTLGVLEGRALYRGPCRPVHVRVAGTAERFWIDLGDPSWRAVEVDADGWRPVDTPPVRFRRPRGLLPLPEPRRCSEARLDDLAELLNVPRESWPLLLAWLVQSYWPAGPYPILALYGEQGSAKSTTARLLRDIIDPSAAPLRSLPRDERDLVIAASNGWVLALDNASAIKDWLSDALCRLATGGGYATRELFSDDSEAIFEATRPVIITSIEGLPGRPDLVDRSVLLELPAIAAADRKPERALLAQWQCDRPYLLAALLDLLSGAARKLPDVQLPRLPRMADFALLGTAVERALAWPQETFAEAYRDNIAAASSAALDVSVLTGPLRTLLQLANPWHGTCQALLEGLRQHLETPDKPPTGWPKNARSLSAQLRRLAPALRKAGISLEMGRTEAGSSVRLTQQQAGDA
jgi:hypothetical protein